MHAPEGGSEMNTNVLSGAMTRLGADESSVSAAIEAVVSLRSETHTRSPKVGIPVDQPQGAVVLNSVLVSLVFSVTVDEDGTETISVRSDNIGIVGWALLSRLQGNFGHTARPNGMSPETREPGFGFVMMPFAKEQAGAYAKVVYRMRDAARESVKTAPSREKTQNLLTLNDFVSVVEHVLGDPVASVADVAMDDFISLF